MNGKEMFWAVYNGEDTEYYGDIRESMAMGPNPVTARDAAKPDGQEYIDSWGVTFVWPQGAPGKHPFITEENKVITDITKWKSQLVVPSALGLDWSAAEDWERTVNRDEKFVYYFFPGGLFERTHFLMGMEDAFCAYLEEPEAMYELLTAIKDFRVNAIKEAAVHIHPEVIFAQDDWGNKTSLFLPPDVWREMIKPLQKEIVDVTHEIGAMYFHHADCVCDVICEDMVELGIDLWQGVIPQNDIIDVQKRTEHKLAMAGGVDVPAIDSDLVTDDDIRTEARRCIDTYCPGGRFFPQATPFPFNDHRKQVLLEEMKNYGYEWAQKHPIDPSTGLPS